MTVFIVFLANVIYRVEFSILFFFVRQLRMPQTFGGRCCKCWKVTIIICKIYLSNTDLEIVCLSSCSECSY